MKHLIFASSILFSAILFAQTDSNSAGQGNSEAKAEERMQSEFEEFEGVEENPVVQTEPTAGTESPAGEVNTELPPQDTLPRQRIVAEPIKENRYPVIEERFVKPPAPSKSGGSLRVQHPDAAKGLLRINKDGSYQYKVKLKEKSKSAGFQIGTMSAPKIESGVDGVTFDTMYGSSPISAAIFNYEWQPFRKFGSLGFNLSGGFATTKASGFLANNVATRSEEVYTLYMFPLSANLVYRFEYGRRQFVVPYLIGGGTYYGIYESRDDNKKNKFAGAAAVGGGGGVLISLSKWDANSAFTLSEEYGVSDMWLSLEGRAMKGLKQDVDFTSQAFYGGITVDF